MDQTASFSAMVDGTPAEWRAILAQEQRYFRGHPGSAALAVLGQLGSMQSLGYPIDALAHSLQTATRARRAGADREMIVVALFHDIGEYLAPHDHGAFAAALLGPHISEQRLWLVRHHAVFQMAFYEPQIGAAGNAHLRYRGHPGFEETAHFCEQWDQTSFDRSFAFDPLESFRDEVAEVFARPPVPFAIPSLDHQAIAEERS